MNRIFDGITLETLPDAIRQSGIIPGQRFSIVLDGDLTLTEIAAQMRQDAAKHGMTAELFDRLIVKL